MNEQMINLLTAFIANDREAAASILRNFADDCIHDAIFPEDSSLEVEPAMDEQPPVDDVPSLDLNPPAVDMDVEPAVDFADDQLPEGLDLDAEAAAADDLTLDVVSDEL